MNHLIIGYGEVGKALHKVLRKAYYIDLKGSTWSSEAIDVAHVCLPYSKEFKSQVAYYTNDIDLVIVHSTVPVGTCDILGYVHSPIRGVHPYLEKGIRTFVKYFGGVRAKEAASIFKKLGIQTKTFPEARTTEALKLWDTTQYARLIMLEKEIYEWCKKNNIDFDSIYTEANKDYNRGYIELGRPEVVRPYLKHIEGKIGGHCVIPNARLLKVRL